MAKQDMHQTDPDNNYVKKVGSGDYQLRTQIDIDAPASVVWETLTDFDTYEWSSSFKGLDKPVAPGAKSPIDDTHSRFIQRDRPHGGIAMVAGRFAARSFAKMYEKFNAELKAEAERRHRAA